MYPEFMVGCTTLSAEPSSHVAMTSNLRLDGTLLLVGGGGGGGGCCWLGFQCQHFQKKSFTFVDSIFWELFEMFFVIN